MAQAVDEKLEQFDLSKKLSVRDLQVNDTGFFVKNHPSLGNPTNGKRVFVRCDFNVPLNNGQITDDNRITATIPTLKHILDMKPSLLILCSHLGRPKGKVVPECSLKPVADRLTELLGQPVNLVKDWAQDDLPEKLKAFAGGIVLLENVRFYVQETGKGVSAEDMGRFSNILTSTCDVYVNDAFGTSHRAHSSMVGVKVPIRAAGLLVEKELKSFAKVLQKPENPFLAILGGAKVSDKIKVIESLLDRVDKMIIAGGMCFTFLKTLKQIEIGKSLFDEPGSETVASIVQKAEQKNVKLIFPVDAQCGDDFKSGCEKKYADLSIGKENGGGVPETYMGLDVGPKTIQLFEEEIPGCKTVVFNGPPGVFEFPEFSDGTKAMLDCIEKCTKNGGTTIVGGGDSAAACKKFGYLEKVTHVSTGGGASLELLEGKVLPGLKFLADK